ncbi:MAG: DsbA family oxidoreductase [Candidatus Nanopelagicales bacterium]
MWADLVCPWCFIGKRRLQRALEEFGIDPQNNDDVQIVHRAFQLDPSASTHSEPTIDHLAAKYGVSRDQALAMMDNVTAVAATEGLDYHLDRTMTGNTRDVHRFLLWVQDIAPESTQPLLADLYAAYFERGERIFTIEDLEPFAAVHDLDPRAMREVLESRDYLETVASDQATARDIGASGVPFFVFNDAVGLSGAQPIEAFRQALEQARG